jgi:hypothetical protein
MKKARDVDDLAGKLAQAAAAPLVAPPAPTVQQQRLAKPKKAASVSIFLRVPQDLHARLEGEAIARTKQTGRGVTVQQVILDKLARPE